MAQRWVRLLRAEAVAGKQWHGEGALDAHEPEASAARAPEHLGPQIHTLNLVNGRLNANGRIAWVFVGTVGTV